MGGGELLGASQASSIYFDTFSVRRPCSDFTDMLWRLTNRRIIIIIIIIIIISCFQFKR